MNWIYLMVAIVFEIIATSFLTASHGFKHAVPTVIAMLCYTISLFLLALVLKTIPVGIAYALWSGVGIVCVTVVGFLIYKQSLDAAALTGIGLIVLGVIVINVFSSNVKS